MDIFNAWQFYLAVYYVSAVLFVQNYKIAVSKVERDGVATVILQAIATAGLLVFVPFFEMKWPGDWKWYALLLAASVFYAVNDRAVTTARKNLEVSIYSILNQSKKVLTIVFGFIIFKEAFLLNKLFGIVLLIAANVMIVYSGGKFRLNKYIWVSFLASLMFAMAITIDVGISQNFNFPLYLALTVLIPMIMIIFAEKVKLWEVKEEIRGENKKYYFITGIFWSIAIFSYIRALQLGTVTVVAPLSAITVLLNVVVASIYHKEKSSLVKKVIAAILTIIGIALIFSVK